VAASVLVVADKGPQITSTVRTPPHSQLLVNPFAMCLCGCGCDA
jgi:hypothetical protein